MKFTDIRQALFELNNIARGGQLSHNNITELVVINPKAKMSARDIRSTSINENKISKSDAVSILYQIELKCDLLQRAFIAFYWGYEDLFGCDDAIRYISSQMSGSYEENRCYIMYYRDKNKRYDWLTELSKVLKSSNITAKRRMYDKESIKRIILDALMSNITNTDYFLATQIEQILNQNELLTK